MSAAEPKYAPKREDGLFAYVISNMTWGQTSECIKWCVNLKDAKAVHGWTRQLHTTISVRRATPAELASLPDRGSRRG